jgi:CBS domain-containing protein
MKIEDAMTAPVETVRPEASLKDVADIFAERGFGGLPVVDEEQRMLGVITEADIVLKEQAEVPMRGLGRVLRRREADALRRKVEARTVGEAMTSPVVTVEHWLSVSAAAELMIEHGVNRLPVLQGRELVGIITRHDLVRAFARSDSEIEQEIRDDTFANVALPESLRVMVKDGEVLLRGEVESKYEAEAIPSLIRRIPGVVAVDSELNAYDAEAKGQVVVSVRR